MSEHQRIKSGILAIVLGLGISMCTPMLFLLIRAMLHSQNNDEGMIATQITYEQKLNAEPLPLEKATNIVDNADDIVMTQLDRAPYLHRYCNSLRPFPKGFFIHNKQTALPAIGESLEKLGMPYNETGLSLHSVPAQEPAGPSLSAIHAAAQSLAEQNNQANQEGQKEDSPQESLSQAGIPVLAHSQILAYYGKPGVRSMGILGQYSKEQLAPMLEKLASEYDALNGDLGIVPAFYIIYGTCWPEGNIGYVSKTVVKDYIEFALARGWIVFLDHQIGKYDVVKSLETMFEFLSYPNVHLALDPEWRTTKPMKEIGYVTADEINRAQERLQEYLVANKFPGPRMLVIHQFKPKMIMNRDAVKATYDQVILIHVADGFGNPQLKKSTYSMIAQAKNIPVKGFKLFYPPAIQGAGWDNPLMSPLDVLSLEPMPLVIMYQ